MYTKADLVFLETKSWLQLSPDWKMPSTFPGQKTPRTLLGLENAPARPAGAK